jgi:2-dehydro-3-deoxyphosphooctonate aldolase (KDO 8-P synthase)
MIEITDKIKLGENITIGDGRFTLIAGPCAIENETMCMETAEHLKSVCDDLGIQYIFKASFDKANRSSIHSSRGVGIERGLEILSKIKREFDVPTMTDVHETWQCAPVAETVDILQIPAFLSRQTDLIVAAAKTGRIVNIKKGQFLAPWDMKQAITKCIECGNPNVMLTERGTSFGYNTLVVDMTALIEMRKYGHPVIFDATHAVQKPGGNGTSSGGNREYVPYLMDAALAVGVDGIFAEVHPDPDNAISDAANQLKLSAVKPILQRALDIHNIILKNY